MAGGGGGGGKTGGVEGDRLQEQLMPSVEVVPGL